MFFYDLEFYDFWGQVCFYLDVEFKIIILFNFFWIFLILGICFEMFVDGLKLFFFNGELFKDLEIFFEERDQV